MSEPTLNPELKQFEAALRTLVPAASAVQRDQLMFRAGQASGARRSWLWPAGTAASLLLAATLGTLLWLRPAPEPVVRIVTLPAPAPQEPTAPVVDVPSLPRVPVRSAQEAVPLRKPDNYLQRRDQAVRWGVEILPSPPPLANEREETTTPARLFELAPGTIARELDSY